MDGLVRTCIWCAEGQEGLVVVVADLLRPFAGRARRDPRWRLPALNVIPDAYILIPQTVADLFDEAARAI